MSLMDDDLHDDSPYADEDDPGADVLWCNVCDTDDHATSLHPTHEVKPYGQQRLDGFACLTCGAEFGPDESFKAEAHGQIPIEPETA